MTRIWTIATFFVACLIHTTASYAASADLCFCETREGDLLASLFVDGSGVGPFNAIGVNIFPSTSSLFLNYDADGISGTTPLGPNDIATFTNALLAFPQVVGGYGFVVVGNSNDGPSGITYATGPLGQFIDASAPIFLNNFIVPIGTSFSGFVTLESTGDTVFRQDLFLPLTTPIGRCPEPACALIAAPGVAVLAMRRRKS